MHYILLYLICKYNSWLHVDLGILACKTTGVYSLMLNVKMTKLFD